MLDTPFQLSDTWPLNELRAILDGYERSGEGEPIRVCYRIPKDLRDGLVAFAELHAMNFEEAACYATMVGFEALLETQDMYPSSR